MSTGSPAAVKQNHLVPAWAIKENRVYAGIGSRETPPDILRLQTKVAKRLGELDYWQVSGGAPGADTAFYEGAPEAQTAFVPWEGFQDFPMVYPIVPEAYEIASLYHKGWNGLSFAVRKLMARNCQQVLGYNLKHKVAFVLCWTSDGCEKHSGRTRATGGTGQAISVASENDIPVYNMFHSNWHQRLYEEQDINLYDLVTNP